MFNKFRLLIVPAVMFVPLVALGQGSIEALLGRVQGILGTVVPTLIGLALVLFLWGVLKYLFSKDGPSQSEAKQFMIWGILALFIMVSVWGIVNILGQFLFGTENISEPKVIPGVPQRTR